MSQSEAKIRDELEAGLAHHRAGRVDAAEAAYRKVLKRRPNHPDALNLLGVIAQDQGDAPGAVRLISQALQARRHFPEAFTNLARAQRATGDPAAAAASARRAISAMPDLGEAHLQLGRALLDLKDDVGAAYACRRAVELMPGSLDARVNLAAALVRLQDFSGAAEAYQVAHRMKPDRAETLTDFAIALTGLERYEDALRCHRRAVALAPDDARTHAGLAATLKHLQDVEGSTAACRKVVALAPDNVDAWLLLANNLAALGRFDEAIACHRRVLELNPDCAESHRGMIVVGEQMKDAAEVARLRAVVRDAALPAGQRIPAGFALGALLDRQEMYDEAFEHYATANRLAKDKREEEGNGFAIEDLRHHVDGLIASYTPALFKRMQGWGTASELPVFIVGMPRSGTTLTEQIAASHAAVFGAGERREIARAGAALGGADGLLAPGRWSETAVRREAESHIARLTALGGDAVRVVDKMPDNIFALGLIAILFPGARIVLCRRDLRDVCLSCHFQSFSHGLSWSNDLTECAMRAREVERLVRHWRRVLPLKMLEVGYEKVVADLEGESKRLIDFLGLAWDPACLSFHQTERQVITASLWQVRQPLYASSVGRWRHYQRHLGPLLAALKGLVPAEPPGAAEAGKRAGGS